ncbi:sensor histidine kinase [Xanthomonas arboricola]|uniref:sensor histidine kinase n=1 Tax=Xanthomonas arboricola TaxID=56448 RepID=UPI001F0B25F5|nr:ATP-binding protein [Xanthomonas arboricola]
MREPWRLPLWRYLVAWLRRVPASDSIDRRNAPALQVLLIFLGTEIPLNKGYHLLTATRIQMDRTQLAVDIGTDAAMTLAAWLGVWMIRRGKVKTATATFIGVTLCSGIAANIAFGYQLQAFDPYPMMMLTLAALVIGRWALWSVYASIPLMFWLGMESPEGQGPAGQGSPFQNLPSLALSYLMITLVLDRTVEALREGLFSARRSAQRLRLEMRERERVQERLLHLQKIESVGHLASGVSHDFNNILGVIIGYTAQRHRLHELDFDPIIDSQAMGEALEGVELAAQRGVAISRKLLSFSRRELTMPSNFNVADSLSELQPMLRQLFGGSVKVELTLPDMPCLVHADRGQFDLVMLNFAANARDAMPDGGTYALALSLEGGQVVLRISDTGVGMGAAVMRQAFEPFFTTKPAGQGTGLGLAVAQEMTEQAGGTLWVDSAPSQGTRFTLRLPQVER